MLTGLILVWSCFRLSAAGRSDDFQVAALFSIHSTVLGIDCEAIDPVNVLLAETHRIAVDWANRNILHKANLSMGTRLADTCDRGSTSLQQAVSLVGSGFCRASSITSNNSSSLEAPVVAITGVFSSEIAQHVNYLMQAFCLPVVAASASAVQLDDRVMYPLFARTIPSDTFRAQVIFDVLQAMQWSHVSVIYDNSMLGSGLMAQFKALVDICPGQNADQRLFRAVCVERYFELNMVASDLEIIKWGLKSSTVSVMILLVEERQLSSLNDYLLVWGIDQKKKNRRFQWIIAADRGVVTGLSAFQGALVVQTHRPALMMLNDTLSAMTLAEMKENPWLVELIEMEHKCCMFNDDLQCPYSLVCRGDEHIVDVPLEALEKARSVFNGVALIANAILSLQHLHCGPMESGEKKLCANFWTKFRGSILFDWISNTSIPAMGISPLYNASAQPQFDIYQYTITTHNHRDTVEWIRVLEAYNPMLGAWPLPGQADPVEESEEEWSEIDRSMRECQRRCVGQVREFVDNCCWHCSNCPDVFMFINESVQECQSCPDGQIPDSSNEYLTECVAEPKPALWSLSPETGVLIFLSLIGNMLTVFSGLAMWRRRKTPMIKASTPDLCLLQVLVLVVLFSVTFLLLPSSSALLCGLGWILSTCALVLNHSVALAKSLRLSRPSFFRRMMGMLGVRLSSLLICLTTVLVQCCVVTIWLTWHNPRIIRRRGAVIRCSSNQDTATGILLLLPFMVLILTLIYQRKVSRNPYIFQIRQARYSQAGTLCFLVNYSVMLPMIFLAPQTSSEDTRAALAMCLPVLTGFVTWLTMIFPVIYEVSARRAQNHHEYVKRERSHQFQQGNVMYMIDAVVLSRPRAASSRT